MSNKCVVAEAEEERTKSKRKGPQRLYIIRRNMKDAKHTRRRIDRHVSKVETILSEGTPAKVQKLLQNKTLKRDVRRDGRSKTKKGEPAGKVILDRKAISQMKERAGRSVIGTDVLETDPLDADTVYRSLFRVEDACKLTRSKVKLGPIRHRAARRIKAHVMIAVMAHNLARWLERKSGVSLYVLQLAFGSLRVQEVECREATFWERVELTEEQVELLEAMSYAVPPKRFTVTVPERPTGE